MFGRRRGMDRFGSDQPNSTGYQEKTVFSTDSGTFGTVPQPAQNEFMSAPVPTPAAAAAAPGQDPIQTAGYTQNSDYPQNGGYMQNNGYPQSAGYAQNSGYAQNNGYSQGSYQQPSGYAQQGAAVGGVEQNGMPVMAPPELPMVFASRTYENVYIYEYSDRREYYLRTATSMLKYNTEKR